MDRLNGLVNSALPTLDGGVTPSLQIPPLPESSVTYPVELDSARGRDSRVDTEESQPVQPERTEFPGTERPERPETDEATITPVDSTTEEADEENDFHYEEYEYSPYEYDYDNEYEYDYYDYGTRRKKRQPSSHDVQNDMHPTNVTHNHEAEDGTEKTSAIFEIRKLNMIHNATEIKKNQEENALSRMSKNKRTENNLEPQDDRLSSRARKLGKTYKRNPFMIHNRSKTVSTYEALLNSSEKVRALKRRAQQLRNRREKNRRDDIHPLRRNSHLLQRSKRETGFPFTRYSVEDITWI